MFKNLVLISIPDQLRSSDFQKHVTVNLKLCTGNQTELDQIFTHSHMKVPFGMSIRDRTPQPLPTVRKTWSRHLHKLLNEYTTTPRSFVYCHSELKVAQTAV